MAPLEATRAARAPVWELRGTILELSRPLCLGIVNVTDDSFYEGARSGTPERAIADGLALAEAGFDLLDVGAVSGGAGPPVTAVSEAERLLPTIRGLAERSGVPITADTFSPEVARRAVATGAVAINDIGGGEPEMLEAVAELRCGYVLMHIEGPPRREREPSSYRDPLAHLKAWFSSRIEQALRRGVGEASIVLDPGLDFDLGVEDNLAILRRLGELGDLGRPLFVSLSRKDFLGAVIADSWEGRLPASSRESATAAAAALAVAGGARLLRLHDPGSLDAVRVATRVADLNGG